MPVARIRSSRPSRPTRPAVPPLPSFDALDETHRQIMSMLADLERLVQLLAQPGDGAAAAVLAGQACSFFSGAARSHHETEETFVFPSLLAGADGELLSHLRRLQQDHNWIEEDWLELETHLQALAQGWRGDHVDFLRAALPGFMALQQEHIALEESLIYPEVQRRHAASGQPT